MITFTLITCTYNAADVLQPTLDSVLCQTYPHVEHLFIDGASKDRTLQLINDYKTLSDSHQNGHDVIVRSEPDHGLYDGMNKGIRQATGDYLVFLNAGDRLPAPDTLTKIAATAEKALCTMTSGNDAGNLPAVLYGDTDIVDAEGHFVRHRRLTPPDRLTYRSFLHGMLVCHQAFYARTDLAQATPYNLDYHYSADVDWCIRIMKLAQKRGLQLVRVPAVVSHYLEGGMSVKNHRASLQERFHVMASHYGFLPTLMMHLWFIIRAAVKK